jgi:hypothetical protein
MHRLLHAEVPHIFPGNGGLILQTLVTNLPSSIIRSKSESSVLFKAYIPLICWNDCNYGKNYIVSTPLGGSSVIGAPVSYIVPPLHDTLYRVHDHYGLSDTFCGYDAPYNPGTMLNGSQSPPRHIG